ncbi:MAG TPA: alpha/beta family hydrolase, partial [Burkholderiales bacterium]|nr:alpha/beta family hydrolase [Burkholderiales bacterium]
LSQDAVFVCAHGAGGHMADGGMTRAAQTLAGAGFNVVRFNFPYREKGSGRPDPMPVLKAAVAEAALRTRRELAPRKLIIGGRSMGGRAASMLAADGFDCDGLLLLAYPLHPAGQPEKLRAAHLPQIKLPVLCFNGTRDALCDRKLMDPIVAGLDRWQMHWLDGADHSFHVLKSSGRTDDQVMQEVGATAQRWLAGR